MRVDTEGARFDTDSIVVVAWRRVFSRLEALAAEFRAHVERHRARGETPPPSLIARYNRTAGGNVRFLPSGAFELSDTAEWIARGAQYYGPRVRISKFSDPEDTTYFEPPPMWSLEYAAQVTRPRAWAAAVLDGAINDERAFLAKVRLASISLAIQTARTRKASII